MGTAVILLILAAIFGGGDSKPDDNKGLDNKRGDYPSPPYPLPRPYAASATKCFRSGERYNAAILGTPEDVVAVLNWLGIPIGKVELLQADAMAKTPLWEQSKGYAPKASQRLKIAQAYWRSLGTPGHKGAPASSVDGVWGECSAVSTDASAQLAEDGRWTPP